MEHSGTILDSDSRYYSFRHLHSHVAEPSISSVHFILFLVHQAQPFEPHTLDQERWNQH